MNKLVTTAIVGTGQIDNNELITNTPVDALAAQLPANSPERSLLLTAGATAVYRQAGYCAEPAPAIPQPDPAEAPASCSAKAAFLLANLLPVVYWHGNALRFGSSKDSIFGYDASRVNQSLEVLIEALQRLQQVHLRLPHELLSQALTYARHYKELRPALIPVLGERGRWLSQFNQEWAWVNQSLLRADKALPANTEIIWQEGTLEQRSTVLRNLREIDPARARDWLVEVWKQEKAEARQAFISIFELNLSSEDEPFLENALDDRSANVQSAAVLLLAGIPHSALAQRMCSRADGILAYTKGKIIVTMPQAIDEHWKHDGLSKDDVATRATLQQILALVPPDHWEQRFAAIPETLIAAIKEKEAVPMLVESWSKAVLLHNNTNWISPLLDMWQHLHKKSRNTDLGPAIQLIGRLPQQDAENIIAHLIFEHVHWNAALTVLFRPWSHSFGEVYLKGLQDHVRTLKKSDPACHEWKQILDAAATALPESCFEKALQPWEMPEEEQNGWVVSYWRSALTDFSEVIRTRKQIMEEIR